MNPGPSTVTLAELTAGTGGLIASVDVKGLLKRRILDLGIVPGTPIHLVRTAPSGDPIAFSVRGAVIALRRNEANAIKVRPL